MPVAEISLSSPQLEALRGHPSLMIWVVKPADVMVLHFGVRNGSQQSAETLRKQR